MRKLLYISLIALMGLGSCSSQKKLQTEPPFVVEGPTCQKWTGGKEESGSGLDVKIPIAQIKEENISMQHLYFRGEVAEVSSEIIDGSRYAIAKFSFLSLEKPDIIMHSDSTKEFGNQPPKLDIDTSKEFPFELSNDEAVLSYIESDGKKVKYTKISGIKEKQPLIYSSKPMN